MFGGGGGHGWREEGCSHGKDAASTAFGRVDVFVTGNPELRLINPDPFGFLVHAEGESRDLVHDPQDGECDAETPSKSGHGVCDLVNNLEKLGRKFYKWSESRFGKN